MGPSSISKNVVTLLSAPLFERRKIIGYNMNISEDRHGSEIRSGRKTNITGSTSTKSTQGKCY